MPKRYSSRAIERVLAALGFTFVSQSGSHGKFRSNDGRIVILPMNKREIPVGTFKSILKQSGVSQEDFERLADE
jgi:predicted RNA binding protein YcfA (HicA-like mRNA interferase family)